METVMLSQFIIALVVVGAVLFLLSRVSWIDPTIRLVIQVILVVFVVIWGLKILLPMAGLG